jgi:polyisoprenyl-phosphate glycosyltransferase
MNQVSSDAHSKPSYSCLLGIVVPCFNEEPVLPETAKCLKNMLIKLINSGKISEDSKIYFIDDGSKDSTWKIIESFVTQDKYFSGIKLSRNQGHQKALLAGLLAAEGDALISIDADLQDDVNVIEEMVDAYLSGNDLVYGIRNNRSTDSLFKRLSAELYYRLLKSMGVSVVFNHADYRLMSRRAIDCLAEYSETNLFLRGIVSLIGLPSTCVYYSRQERFAGQSKYPLGKMFALAVEGITSFSAFPLRIITCIGIIAFLVSSALGFWALYMALFRDTVLGWASIVVPIFFFSSVQLLSIGVIGEYLAKIYTEVKKRPRYFIDKII